MLIDPQKTNWTARQELAKKKAQSKENKQTNKQKDALRPETELPSSNNNKNIEFHEDFGLHWAFWI